MSSPTISVRYLHRIVEAASARGIDPARLCAEAGLNLEQVHGPDELRVPIDRYLRLWGAAMAACRDVTFPLAVAGTARPGSENVLGFACMTAPNLGEALKRAVRFIGLFAPSSWHLEIIKDEAHMNLVRVGDASEGWHPSGLFAVGELVGGARQLTGVRVVPEEVRLTQPASPNDAPLAAFFGCPIRFGATQPGVTFRVGVLALPMRHADPDLSRHFDAMGEAMLQSLGPDDEESKVRRAIADALKEGAPTLERIAPRVGMSSRSLRRRLQERGKGFQALLTEVRAELAKRYLANPRLSLSEVAFLLGFSEPSAFHRAFRRWTGQTAQQFRRDAAPST